MPRLLSPGTAGHAPRLDVIAQGVQPMLDDRMLDDLTPAIHYYPGIRSNAAPAVVALTRM